MWSAVLVLFCVLPAVVPQGWCGDAECGPKPECKASTIDIIFALDESGSVGAANFKTCNTFMKALLVKAEPKFESVRFGALSFGKDASWISRLTGPSRTKSASAIVGRLIDNNEYNEGGTPTDAAFELAHGEFTKTKIAGRPQLLVLLSDGVPTVCAADGYCPDTKPPTSLNVGGSPNFSDWWNTCWNSARQWAQKIKETKALILSIGVGIGEYYEKNKNIDESGCCTRFNAGYSNKTYGDDVITSFASDPEATWALPDADFATLVTDVLPKILDVLCFYVKSVKTPHSQVYNYQCAQPGDALTITGINFVDMGQPQCQFRLVASDGNLAAPVTTPATFTQSTGQDIEKNEAVASCKLPTTGAFATSSGVPFVVEVGRDGDSFSSNQATLTLRQDCEAKPSVAPTPKRTGSGGGGAGAEAGVSSAPLGLQPALFALAAPVALALLACGAIGR